MNPMPSVFVVIEPYLCLHRGAMQALLNFMQVRDVTVSCVQHDSIAGIYKVRLFARNESHVRRILREWAIDLRLPRNTRLLATHTE